MECRPSIATSGDFLVVRTRRNRIEVLNGEHIRPYCEGPKEFWLRVLRHVTAAGRVPDVTLTFNLIDMGRAYDIDTDPTPATPELLMGIAADAGVRGHPSLFAPLPHNIVGRDSPIISLAVIPGLHRDLLMPCWYLLSYAIASHWSWFLHVESAQRRIRFWKDYDRVAWRRKTPVLYWRGGLSGGTITPDTWRRFPRARVCVEAARAGSALLDLALSTPPGDLDPAVRTDIAPLLGSRQPFARNWQYKYLLDLDGNSFSSRLINFLGSGSLVIRPKTVYQQWYFKWLRPGEHYLAIDKYPHELTAEDLIAAVEWARSHDAECRQMVANANELMRFLTPRLICREWLQFLEGYAASTGGGVC